MTSPAFTQIMADSILAAEVHATRFEDFCIDLFREVDGIEYVGTSRTYDLGADGRSVDRAGCESAPFILCSLRRDVAGKFLADLQVLSQHQQPKEVLACSNQPLSDYAERQIRVGLLQSCPTLNNARVLGVDKLAQLCMRYPTAFASHYHAELAAVKDVLAMPDDNLERIEITGMRIALTTQLGSSCQELRDDLIHNLVLSALAGGNPLPPSLIAKHVSDCLHLHRIIQHEWLTEPLVALAKLDQVTRTTDGKYVITDGGRRELTSRTKRGVDSAMEGQQFVRQTIEDLTGETLAPPEFARLWATFQQGIADMFMTHGLRVVEAVLSVVENKSPLSDFPDIHSCLLRLAKQVGESGFVGQRKGVIEQAVRDLFHESHSYAFDWLAGLCSVYASVCLLGLEPAAQQQVEARLREIDLLIDTDVILSLLSEGEPTHESVDNVVRLWQRVGGRMFAPDSVLKEAAYHAWISTSDYEGVWKLLPKMNEQDGMRLIDNAFVRGFFRVARGQYYPRKWSQYISVYKGASEYDYSKLVELLAEYGVSPLMEDIIDPSFAACVGERLLQGRATSERVTPREAQRINGKAQRDGRIVALLHALREQKTRAARGTAVLVSSSTLLRSACQTFRPRLGETEAVVPLAAVAYLLSLVPGVKIALSSLTRVLFDTRFAEHIAPLERLAFRIMKASDEYPYALHWSKRGVLKREIRNQIAKLAAARGQPAHEIEDAVVSPVDQADTPVFAEAVAEALDTVVASESEKELEALRRENLQLRAQLEAQQKRGRSVGGHHATSG